MKEAETKKVMTGGEAGAAQKGSKEEFHFGGGGEYHPLTITATSRQEAEKEWEKTRVKVGGGAEIKSTNEKE